MRKMVLGSVLNILGFSKFLPLHDVSHGTGLDLLDSSSGATLVTGNKRQSVNFFYPGIRRLAHFAHDKVLDILT